MVVVGEMGTEKSRRLFRNVFLAKWYVENSSKFKGRKTYRNLTRRMMIIEFKLVELHVTHKEYTVLMMD